MKVLVEPAAPTVLAPARSRLLTRGASVTAIVVSVGLVAYIPHLVGMAWRDVVGVLAGLSITTVLALAVLWISGLVAHTYVLTAALPGLSHRRALLLNLSGSAVSNLVPFGGAAGVGVGFAMAKTWRIEPTAFAAFTAISNVWNVLGKLLVGSALVVVSIIAGTHLPSTIQHTVLLATGAVFGLSVLAIAVLRKASIGAAVGRSCDRIFNRVMARKGSPRRVHTETAIGQLRAEITGSISNGWRRLTLGIVAYLALQALLLAACLGAVGAHVTLFDIAAAFGVERLLSTLPLTPGGAGFTELGAVAVLVALGGDPVTMAAGVLLYRTFTFLLEIPVGGASALIWLAYRARISSGQSVTG